MKSELVEAPRVLLGFGKRQFSDKGLLETNPEDHGRSLCDESAERNTMHW